MGHRKSGEERGKWKKVKDCAHPCAFLPLRACSVIVAIDIDNWRQTGPCPGLAKASSSGSFSAWGCCAPRCWGQTDARVGHHLTGPEPVFPEGWDVHNDNQRRGIQGAEEEEEGKWLQGHGVSPGTGITWAGSAVPHLPEVPAQWEPEQDGGHQEQEEWNWPHENYMR